MKKLLVLGLLFNCLLACGSAGEPKAPEAIVDGGDTSQNKNPGEDIQDDNPETGGEEQEASDIPPSVASDACMDYVAEFLPGENAGYGAADFPEVVLGPPVGKGSNQGATTGVLSLGTFGSITLCSDTPILNGPGPDFIVFENAFLTGTEEDGVFNELAEVSVLQDPEELDNFLTFPCDTADILTPYSGCAGARPVLANAETNSIDYTNPALAGGDSFDLEDLGLDYAFCVRVYDIDEGGFNFAPNAGADLDGICIVHQ